MITGIDCIKDKSIKRNKTNTQRHIEIALESVSLLGLCYVLIVVVFSL